MNPTLSLEIIESDITNSNLERGRQLYHRGFVKEFKIIDNDFVLAKVQSNKTYKVFLEYVDNDYKAYCNCLYEPKGKCKHQVAVKYTLMDVFNSQSHETKKQSTTIMHLKVYNSFLKKIYKLKYKF